MSEVDEVRLGLLRAAGMDVALPLEALREVVPHPEELAALPVRAPGLLGAMALRNAILPVVDLGTVAHVEGAEAGTGRVVVVVVHEGRLVGVVVDEVRGVASVERDSLQSVAAAGAPLLFSHLVQVGEDAVCVSVLDPAALTGLPGVPSVEERRAAVSAADTADGTGPGVEEGRPSLTVVRCGGQLLALPIAEVRTTVPLTSVTPSVLTGGACLGTTVHGGRELAVLDPMTLLGLEPLSSDLVAAGVVVPAGAGDVVLAVTRLELLQHSPGPTMPVPPQATRRSDLVDGVQQLGDDTCLVLRAEGLRADPDVAAYAALGCAVAEATHESVDDDVAATGPTCLTYAVGGVLVATPLDQVVEILPSPAELTRTHVADVSGLVVHRGQTVTVVPLGPLLGRTTTEPGAGCLLLVEVDGRHVGFAVDRLQDIRPRTWADPEAPTGPDRAAPRRLLETSPLVRVAGVDRLLPELDLHRVARALLDGSTVEAPVLALEEAVA
ncbi:chemotaxis protein CheW [Nocardioides flavescens]|nr:chemotaxis protein CheW [Nocardioides flavescens]